MWVRNYHYSLRNNPEESISQAEIVDYACVWSVASMIGNMQAQFVAVYRGEVLSPCL